MNPKASSDLIEKLAKIKALADDASSDEECKTAMLMFQRLLDKHGMKVSDVVVEADHNEVIEKDVYGAKSISGWMSLFHSIIASHFRCVPVRRVDKSGNKVTHTDLQFIGFENDSMLAAEAFSTSIKAAKRLFKRFWQENPRTWMYYDSENTSRTKYLIGFAYGLHAAYKAQEDSGCLGIIVTTPPEVKEHVSGFKKSNRKFSQRTDDRYGSAGYTAGFNVGKGDRLSEDSESA